MYCPKLHNDEMWKDEPDTLEEENNIKAKATELVDKLVPQICKCDICVDFDGVIHIQPEGAESGSFTGVPNHDMLTQMAGWIKQNLKLAVFSVRSIDLDQRDRMADFIKRHKPEIFQDLQFPNHKPDAKVYLDDRGIRYHGPDTDLSIANIQQLFTPWHRKE